MGNDCLIFPISPENAVKWLVNNDTFGNIQNNPSPGKRSCQGCKLTLLAANHFASQFLDQLRGCLYSGRQIEENHTFTFQFRIQINLRKTCLERYLSTMLIPCNWF